MSKYDTDECKICIIHEYGVYALNTVSLSIILLVGIVYRKEIVAYCRGTAKLKAYYSIAAQRNSEPANSESSRQLAPDALDTLKKNNNADVSISMPRPVEYLTKPNQPPQSPVGVKIYVAPENPNKTSSRLPVDKFRNNYSVNRLTSPAAPVVAGATPSYQDQGPPRSPNKPPKTNDDPFKLPKRHDTQSPFGKHESTGSDYFKQIMRGKKAVGSISQYLQLRHFNKKDKKKEGTDKKHHKRKNKKRRDS